MTKKNEVFKKFKEYKVIVEAQTWHKLKCFRFNNGGEFMFGKFNQFSIENGIWKQFIVLYTLKQNEVVERSNYTLIESVWKMFFSVGLSKML